MGWAHSLESKFVLWIEIKWSTIFNITWSKWSNSSHNSDSSSSPKGFRTNRVRIGFRKGADTCRLGARTSSSALVLLTNAPKYNIYIRDSFINDVMRMLILFDPVPMVGILCLWFACLYRLDLKIKLLGFSHNRLSHMFRSQSYKIPQKFTSGHCNTWSCRQPW